MSRTCRYNKIDRITLRSLFALLLIAIVLTGCGKAKESEKDENSSGFSINISELREGNSDIFGWLYVPDTQINGPLLQNMDGDDSFYVSHDATKEPSSEGALHINSANLSNMCDFNEIVYGASAEDLLLFEDRTYFEDHDFIYVYLEGNSLVYYIIAAYTRNSTDILAQYDFSYASGCQEFIDEIYSGRSMNKNIRSGFESGLSPEHFLLTLSAESANEPGKQIVVIGCLVGDASGQIDRVVDWTSPDDEY